MAMTLDDLTPPRQEARLQPSGFSSGGFIETRLVALHESVGATDAYGLADYMPRIGASYNAIVDNEVLLYTVLRTNQAYHIPQGINRIANGLCLTTPVRGYSRAQWLGSQVRKTKAGAWYWAVVAEAEKLDVMLCSRRNILDARGGSKSAGGCTMHKDCDAATGDPTPHVDPRNFPADVAIKWAQEAAGYANYGEPFKTEPEPEPEDRPQRDTYVIRSGDTLGRIAQRFNTTLDRILAVNKGITDPDRIQVGQIIVIPDEDQDMPLGPELDERFAEFLRDNPELQQAYGAPVTSRMPLPDDEGYFQRFTKAQGTPRWAHLYYIAEGNGLNVNSGVFAVYGSIMAAYGDTTSDDSQHGWERGPLGLPQSSEYTPPAGTGVDRVTLFEYGWIGYTAGEGAVVHMHEDEA